MLAGSAGADREPELGARLEPGDPTVRVVTLAQSVPLRLTSYSLAVGTAFHDALIEDDVDVRHWSPVGVGSSGSEELDDEDEDEELELLDDELDEDEELLTRRGA